MRFTSSILIIFLGQILLAQSPIGSSQQASIVSFDYFQKGQFESVTQVLAERKDLTIQENYLLRISQLRLGAGNSNHLQKLLKENPKYALNSIANYAVGQQYFHLEDFTSAAGFLKKVDVSQLLEVERSDFYFMRGYISMINAQYKNAVNYFARRQQLTEERSVELSYYQGFSFYHLNQKEKALGYLEKVAGHDFFGVSSNFFQAKIKLEDGKYSEVVALAQTNLSDEKSEVNAAFYQLIGEAYARQNQVQKASSYFNKAVDLHPGKPTAALYYQAGVANFRIGLKSKAIEFLTQAGIRSGAYAELSAFQLARLFVSLGEKDKALAAYIEASASKDAEMREEATFYAGKLEIDLQNHAEGINYLKDYLENYTEGKWTEETQQLLAESYLRTSDYDQAIEHLQAVGVSTTSQKEIYQKVTFQKAQLLYNDANLSEARRWFQESLKYPQDVNLGNEAWFLTGEVYFLQSKFEDALRAYRSQNQPAARSFYGMAYANYNLERYAEAAQHFQRALSLRPSQKLRDDSEVRLADCYYATKSYQKALAIYKKYSQRSGSPYLFYQTGLVSKNLGNVEEAIKAFEKVVNVKGEAFKDDAIFQLAQLKFESAEFEHAEFYFSRLISEYPNSSFSPEAYLNRAVCRTNLGKFENAKEDFELVLDKFLSSKIAFNAILGLQELESKGVKVGNVQAQIEKYKKANPNDDSLEVIEFDFAKSQYFDLAYSNAVTSFLKFIRDYPESSSLIDAKYYLADSYYRNDRLVEAKQYFGDLRGFRNNLTGRVLSRLGEINYRMAEFSEANASWKELIALDITPKDTYNGRAGLMKSYYAESEFQKALEVADQIIKADWQPLNATRKALLTRGNAYSQLGNQGLALENYSQISNGTDLISAEAGYNIARMSSRAGKYQESLDTLFSFNSRFGSYGLWIDKSYLLIADNYVEMGELFQAKATLRSIIQHSEDPKARARAQERLSSIEKQVIEDTDTTNTSNN